MSEVPQEKEFPFPPAIKKTDSFLVASKCSLKNILMMIFFLPLLIYSFALAGQSPRDQEADKVLQVVDGDTLKIAHQNRIEKIRLIGIDTPESRVNPKAKKDAARNQEDVKKIISLGQEATRYVKSLVKPGDTIRIEFDRQIRDKYGRLLGYVYLPNGKMLNEEIVKAGYANLMTYPPNVKYEERFLKAYQEARGNNRGLWSKH
jgi:micrococcal nuclease